MLRLHLHKITLHLGLDILDYLRKVEKRVLKVDQEMPMQVTPISFFCFKGER